MNSAYMLALARAGGLRGDALPDGSTAYRCPLGDCTWSHSEPRAKAWEIGIVLASQRTAYWAMKRRSDRIVQALVRHGDLHAQTCEPAVGDQRMPAPSCGRMRHEH